jgi:hypothetical protein
VADNYDTLCCEITTTGTGLPENCCNKIDSCHNPQGYDPKFLPSKNLGTFIELNQCGIAYACAVSCCFTFLIKVLLL